MEYNELILDMLNRIVKLEKEVEQLKSERTVANVSRQESEALPRLYVNSLAPIPEENARPQRDKTRYMFNGNIYLKNKLVLAVVKDYVQHNVGITGEELKRVFDKSLQGSMGVVEYEFIARQRSNYHVRFFAKEDEVLRLSDGNMLVCSQWGILNIPHFLKRAAQLGYKIEEIIRE